MSAPALQVGQRARLTRMVMLSADGFYLTRGEPVEITEHTGSAGFPYRVRQSSDPDFTFVVCDAELEVINAND